MENREAKKSGRTRRIIIGLVGGVVVVVGIILIPYPGPGWLVVFGGLAILAQEFPWAERLLHRARTKYDGWNAWIKRRNIYVQSLTFIGTALVVVATLWLINAYGLLDTWFHLGLHWVHSPFFK